MVDAPVVESVKSIKPRVNGTRPRFGNRGVAERARRSHRGTRAADTCRNHSQPINNGRGCGQIN